MLSDLSGAREEPAAAIAGHIGARHVFIESHELEDPSYRANPINRCYYCKLELFGKLRVIAVREGLSVMLDGSNADDEGDFRPGRLAAKEYDVRSPLAELGIGKALVRKAAREQGLPNWDQPSGACLASRIPYGQEISPSRVGRVARTETALHALGFRTVRVRDHGELARIEIPRGEFSRAIQPGVHDRIVGACKQQGYTYICLDLLGFRSGSMNEVLGRPYTQP